MYVWLIVQSQLPQGVFFLIFSSHHREHFRARKNIYIGLWCKHIALFSYFRTLRYCIPPGPAYIIILNHMCQVCTCERNAKLFFSLIEKLKRYHLTSTPCHYNWNRNVESHFNKVLLAFRKCGRQNKKVFYVRGHFDKIWLIYGAAGFDSLDIGTWKFKSSWSHLFENWNIFHYSIKDARNWKSTFDLRWAKMSSWQMECMNCFEVRTNFHSITVF